MVVSSLEKLSKDEEGKRGEKVLAGTLADFAYHLSFNDLPSEIIEKAKISILDALACAFDGHLTETSKIALSVYDTISKHGRATVWVNGQRGSYIDTAWVNCLLVHSMLHDDTQTVHVQGHMGSVIIPTAFAVAEQEGKSGREVLAAIVAAYEIAGRIGAKSCQTMVDHGFRGSGIFGTFAAAVAAGKLLGLNEEQLKHAINCASTFSAGTLEASNCGTGEWRFQNGAAVRNGIIAALLAKGGLKAAETALDGERGFFWAFGGPDLRSKIVDEMDEITESLGKEFEISTNEFKPFATCGFNEIGVDIVVAMVKQHRIKADDIDKITVWVHPANERYPGGDRMGPFETVDQALLSKAFSIAAAIKKRDLQTGDYLTLLNDPDILSLASKVVAQVDESMHPSDSRLEFVLKDGRRIKGDKTLINMSRYELNSREAAVEKFNLLSSQFLSSDLSSKIEKSLFELENMSNISRFTDLFIQLNQIV
jgi:2-methylcitrate dehydratase PrpD